MQVTFKWYKPTKQITNDIIQNKQLGYFLASSAAREMNPYVPMREGHLKDCPKIEPFKVTYDLPYANYQYQGVSKKGNKLNYLKNKHPLATSKWNEAMMKSKSAKLAKEVNAYLKRV